MAFRRMIMVFFGLLVALAAGPIVLPVATALDPAARRAAAAFAHFAFFSMVESGADGSPAFAAIELTRFVWTALVAVCVTPLAIAVLVGEIAEVRSILWYVGATGLFAASAPWVARAAFNTTRMISASPEELRFAFVFFLTGAVFGLVYWALCGRGGNGAPAGPN
jgi:hypothetical protein